MTIENEVLKHYSSLNDTDLSIWKFITNNKNRVVNMTIDEMASHTNVSRTTISRFVKKIGLKGYSELKIKLNIETDSAITAHPTDYDSAYDSLISYLNKLKETSFQRECELLLNANRIFIYGTGDIQTSVAEQFKRMFLSVHELVYTISGKTFDHSIFDIINEDDVIIMISLSGDNKQCLEIAKKCKIIGAKIISITEFKNNNLSMLSDESIYIHSPELNFIESSPKYRITTMYYVLIEMLFIEYSIYKNKKLSKALQKNM